MKSLLLEKCKEIVKLRIETSRQAMHQAQLAANEEGKSSAGDKYETGRAMMQIERDNAAQQLQDALTTMDALEKINLDSAYIKAMPGSLVITDVQKIFLCIGLGKVKVGDDEFFVVAPSAPLGQAMMGLSAGESFTFRQQIFKIISIA